MSDRPPLRCPECGGTTYARVVSYMAVERQHLDTVSDEMDFEEIGNSDVHVDQRWACTSGHLVKDDGIDDDLDSRT